MTEPDSHGQNLNFKTGPGARLVESAEVLAPDTTPGTGTAGSNLGLREEDEDLLEPGHVIANQYEIISLLGRGGMSVVYKAEDLMMRRVVAVKCLHTHLLSDKNSIKRFQKEAQAAGNLDHPHIVKIHQYGLDTDKRPFFVMDYLQGQSLQELMDGGSKIDIDEALRILSEAADGLEQAHKKGVVHRDFKPSNVMLINTEEEQNCVKIVDFGIAKVTRAPGEDGHNLTRTGEMLGSPKYMSPEQCLMLDLDNRSDIYSFGCTMFATITGSAPFSTGSLVEIFYKQINDLPQSIAGSRPGIKDAAALDAVILKCMAKEPADRYQSMAEVKAAIQAIIAGGKQNIVTSLKDQIELKKLKGRASKTKKSLTLSPKLVLVAAIVGSIALTAMAGRWAYLAGQTHGMDQWDQGIMPAVKVSSLAPSEEGSLKSPNNRTQTSLCFLNKTSQPVKVYWLDFKGQRKPYGNLPAGGQQMQNTFVGHTFVVTDQNDKGLAIFVAQTHAGIAVLRP